MRNSECGIGARGMSVRGIAVLLRRFAVGLRMALRFCWNVWRSVHACLFSFVRKKETACDVLRFYSAGSRSPFVRSRYVCMGICLWQVHFGFVRFLQAISTGLSGNGVRGWRRRLCASLRNHIGLAMLSAWSTLGATRPQTCAKESSTLWTLFRGWPSEKVRFARRGCVGTDSRRRHSGTRVDPPGSDKWKPTLPALERVCGGNIERQRQPVLIPRIGQHGLLHAEE